MFSIFIEASLKRKEVPISDGPPAKQQPFINHKERLLSLAKTFDIPAPVYNTVKTNGMFSSTVKYDGNSFQSAGNFLNNKRAEQVAAHVALYVLGEEMEAPDGYDG